MAIKPASGKLESQELNDNFCYLDSKAGSMIGGPKGTFTSESVLKSKYPNGDSHAMLVTDGKQANSYLYMWNGTSWVKGPLYHDYNILT